jgi:hypothetical protein
LAFGAFARRAQRAGGSAILGQVYASIGAAVHERSQPLTVDVAAAALAAGNLDAVPATVIDDPFWDQYVRESHRRSQDALGQEGGSPIVAFDGHTYFGPVITAIPSAQNSAQLFDAVYTVATAPGFSQLQKPRSGPPIFAAST